MRTDLGTMSWRRFSVLIRGLSPNSATATKLSARRYMGQTTPRGERVVEVVGKEATIAAMRSLFGGKRKSQERPD